MKLFGSTTSDAADEDIRFRTKALTTYNNVLIDDNELRKHITLSFPNMWKTLDHSLNDISIGFFSELPLEILYNMFAITDVQSFMYLRATNSKLKYLAQSWPPFRTAMTYAQSLIMALIATRASRMWTFTDTEAVVFTSTCECCGAHAEIIHLLKKKRVCFKCVTVERSLLVVTSFYVQDVMGLSESDLAQLPQLITVPQRSFWGRLTYPHAPRSAKYDYSAAAKLAITRLAEATTFEAKQRNKLICKLSELESHYQVLWYPSDTHLRPEYTRTTKDDPKHKRLPLYQRRKGKTTHQPNQPGTIHNLPSWLTNPPESSYNQHGSCIHLPAYHRASPSAPPQKVKALLCAGCSFYFNYHSALPHQAQTLYAYTDPPEPHISPLEHHLRTCPYAEIYGQYLRPLWLQPTVENPWFAGGRFSLDALNERQHNHRLRILSPSGTRWRHFQRHNLDLPRLRGVATIQNNADFELMPDNVVEYIRNHPKLPARTGLDLEIERKANNNDTDILAMLDDTNDRERFDRRTRDQIERIREAKERNEMVRQHMLRLSRQGIQSNRKWEDPGWATDVYGDVMFQSLETLSQAGWATARPSSSACLFRGWYGLLMERKRREQQADADGNGNRAHLYEIGSYGWGLDRFGCVSGMG